MFNITDLFSSLDSSGNEGQQQQQQQFQPPDAATALSLDDIFNDVMFTPDGQAVFMSEQQPLQFDDPINSPADDVQDVFDDNPIPIHLPSPTPMPFIPSGELQVTNSASKLQTGDGAAFDVAALLQQQQLQQQQLHQQLQAAQLQQQQQLQQQPRFVPVPRAGGLYATQLHQPEKPSLVMGPFNESLPVVPTVPFQKPPQQPYHLQFAVLPKQKQNPSPSSSASRHVDLSTQHPGTTATASTQEQPSLDAPKPMTRKERNREHAKRSRIRKKFLLESLQQSVSLLKQENEKLKASIKDHLGAEQGELLLKEKLKQSRDDDAYEQEDDNIPLGDTSTVIASSKGTANKVLDDPDFSFIKALQTAQQNFIVTDPKLPDNPIVYASKGFLNLTGYSLDQILGRNCRFLQGPETDPKSVEGIRNAIDTGKDHSVCLLNYRIDGSTFWNQFFIAPLRDDAGKITNFVGVQCKVSDQYAAMVTQQQQEKENRVKGSKNVIGAE